MSRTAESKRKPSISVVIPFHNEEKNVKPIIEKVYKVFRIHKFNGEILAIDDRSTDSTGLILRNLKKTIKNLKIVQRSGDAKGIEIGYAIRDGILASKTDTLTIMMGDQSDDVNDIIKMLKKIDEGYDVVCGSRLIKGSMLVNYPKLKLVLMKAYNKLFSLLFSLPVNDFSNAFKTYRRKVFENIKLESKEFEITAEMLLKAYISRFKITEVPVKWFNRKSGESKLGAFSISIEFLLFKLPRIGWRYCVLASKLYLKYLYKNLFGT